MTRGFTKRRINVVQNAVLRHELRSREVVAMIWASLISLGAMLLVSGFPCVALPQSTSIASERNTGNSCDRHLSGVWRVVTSVRLGRNTELKDAMVTIRGTSLTVTDEQNPKGVRLRLTIDAEENPAAIDLLTADEDGTRLIIQGIFERNGKSLTLCLADPVEPDQVDALINDPMRQWLTSRPRRFCQEHGTLVRCQLAAQGHDDKPVGK